MSNLAMWALKYLDGGDFLCFGRIDGWTTLEHTQSPWEAKHFDSTENATSWKNNESHVRHTPMMLVELSLETGIKEHGLVPLTEPDWGDWEREYDEHRREEAEEQFADVYKKHGLTPPPALPEKA